MRCKCWGDPSPDHQPRVRIQGVTSWSSARLSWLATSPHSALVLLDGSGFPYIILKPLALQVCAEPQEDRPVVVPIGAREEPRDHALVLLITNQAITSYTTRKLWSQGSHNSTDLPLRQAVRIQVSARNTILDTTLTLG